MKWSKVTPGGDNRDTQLYTSYWNVRSHDGSLEMSDLGLVDLVTNLPCSRHVHMLGAPSQGLPHGQGKEVDEGGEAGASQEEQGARDGAPS